MKKRALAFAILIVTTIILISISFNVKTVKATNGYNIEHVEHTITVLYNGYVFINDTIQVTGQASDGFLIGFPYKYGPYIVQCVAYNSSDIFPVNLDVPLEDSIGFYGINLTFPHGTPQIFTVGFILSNTLLTEKNATRFTLDFPAYPSFTKPVAINSSILIQGATRISGTVQSFKYGQENLPAFTSMPANITFSVASGKIQSFDIEEFKSEITINQIGDIEGLDSYYITNNAPIGINSIEISLPSNASNPSVQDQFGRTMSASGWVNQSTSLYNVSFIVQLGSDRSAWLYVKYGLPSNYIIQVGTSNFNFKFPLFQGVNYYIKNASVSFALPEGAKILDFKNTFTDSLYDLTKNVFQETVTISRRDVSYLETILPSENILQFTYQYDPLWSSFRPTLWM